MRVFSIFLSVDGETNLWGQGRFSTFIRLAGCNLACSYCDTQRARPLDAGNEMLVEDIMKDVHTLGCKKITITGGEPLLQSEELKDLIEALWFSGHHISVETNGSFAPTLRFVGSWVMDYKLPSSGMQKHMVDEYFGFLGTNDYVKFVIQDEKDYREACLVRKRLGEVGCEATFAFGVVFGRLSPKVLIEWLKRDGILDVQINTQLHKLLRLEEDV